MGMQKKLMRAQIQGAVETWELMEDMFLKIEGIGPKTREKILREIQKYANKEKAKIIEKYTDR